MGRKRGISNKELPALKKQSIEIQTQCRGCRRIKNGRCSAYMNFFLGCGSKVTDIKVIIKELEDMIAYNTKKDNVYSVLALEKELRRVKNEL